MRKQKRTTMLSSQYFDSGLSCTSHGQKHLFHRDFTALTSYTVLYKHTLAEGEPSGSPAGWPCLQGTEPRNLGIIRLKRTTEVEKAEEKYREEVESRAKEKGWRWDFPAGPVARTPHSQWRGPGIDPWSGNQIPYATTKSSHAATLDSACHDKDWRSCVPQLRPGAAK